MEERIYDYWAATLQDGYLGQLIKIVEKAGGAKALHEIFGKYRDRGVFAGVFEKIASGEEEMMITKKLAEHIAGRWKSQEELKRDYYKMMSNNIGFVKYDEADFPKKLKNIPGPPYGLFVKGALPDENKKSVAIVGARECSEYGRICAAYFGDRIARRGVQIISGMAWGIDGISQMAAVQAGGTSFGVLGSGVDIVYPKKNKRLYEMLCEKGSGVISEYAPGTEAIARCFPPRNRIISGLCDVLLVIEARAKSGTLITVSMAAEQGKTVMTLPGRITDELSRGCLMLLREGGIPVTSVDDVMEELDAIDNIASPEKNAQIKEGENITDKSYKVSDAGHDLRTIGKSKKNMDSKISKTDVENYADAENTLDLRAAMGIANAAADIELGDDERKVYDSLTFDLQSAEEISIKCHMSISDVLIALSRLDLKGFIREAAVGEFVRSSQSFNE